MSLTTPYREQFLIADGVRTIFPFDDHGDGFDAISKNYVKCEVYNADGSVIVPDFTVDLSAKTITITSLTTPDGQILNAPQSGAIVRIYRDVPETQNTTVQALQASTAKQIVQNFDNIVAMIQELQYANEHFTLRSTLPQRDLQIDLLRDIDDQKLVYWDKEKRKLVVTNYRQDEILLPADKEDILSQANKYSDAQNNVLEERINDSISSLESTINGKLSAVDTQIDANADAILKTREDFASADQAIRDDMNAEDSRLQTQITAQAAAITTNKNDIDELGDDVAEIQAKIPESASGTNHLITKQQLLDEEMDIRDDLNEGLSELQTQITAQAAEIATKQDQLIAGDNIIISGNVISATSGGAGLDFIVVQELPEAGQKGIIYLLAKDGTAPDIYDEYVWITATQTFELIGSTKVDLSDYATKEDLENIDVLPDQTSNGGKFLTTDGTAASWSDKPLVNKASDPSSVEDSSVIVYGIPNKRWCSTVVGAEASNANGYGTVVGYKASGGSDTVVIGIKANADSGIAIGKEASSKSTWSIAIGNTASANKANSIALGENAKTEEAHTFVVGLGWDGNNSRYANYKLLNFDGTIPVERMSATAGTTGQVLTKTDTGMAWQDPSGGTTITLKEYDE